MDHSSEGARTGGRPELGKRVLQALCQVLLLHGGELPVSIAGDELRRRHSQIWKDWKSKVPDASLLRLCSAAQPYGLSLENLESLDEQAASSGEPVIRLQRSEAETGSFVPLGGYDAADSQQEFPEESNFLRSALVSRFERHPSGSQGGAVPVAWLTIALEKELLRHIRGLALCSDVLLWCYHNISCLCTWGLR